MLYHQFNQEICRDETSKAALAGGRLLESFLSNLPVKLIVCLQVVGASRNYKQE